MPTLASLVVGPVQFDRPMWLVLVPVLGVMVVLLGMRSLSGLSGSLRWTAMTVRVVVIALLASALAEPHTRRESKDVSVTVILDESRSIPPLAKKNIELYLAVALPDGREGDDRLGLITAAEDSYVQSMPSTANKQVESQFIGSPDGTNLAGAVSLALATVPKDAAARIVLVSDGNETDGSVLAAARQAKAVGIPIDVLPVRFNYENEVIVDQLSAPAAVRAGETINLRVVLTATRPALGRVLISENGNPIDLDPDSDALGVVIELKPGKNVISVQVAAVRPGPQSYEAVFEPISAIDSDGNALPSVGDSIIENNRAMAITFVESEGRVLVVADSEQESGELVRALRESEILVHEMRPDEMPSTLAKLNGYEAIVLVNQQAPNFTELQQDMLRQYIHDSGGGLVMTGGPSSFGAGGWIGSPLEDALPIKLDPPQKRQMPRGALVIVVHSIEVPQGVFYGKEVCNAAVDALSRLDMIGIVEYSAYGGTDWVYPISTVGDRTAVKRAIQSLQFGDMPDFDPSLNLALRGLKAAAAGQKHLIVISDGDPSLNRNTLTKFINAGITISTVGVNPHSPRDYNSLRTMATRTGGTFYPVSNNALATLPQIFIKEAQTIRRSLIWEGEPFAPAVVNIAAEPMRGITSVPKISGYIVAAEREGLSLVTLRGKESDPIAAQWQYGLGKVVTFTSDVSSRWGSDWIGWGSFKQYWEQHIRWAMRPGGNANIRVNTETRGDSTLIIVEAFDSDGERMNFANFKGRTTTPDGKGQDVAMRQVGPGRYEGVFNTADPGAYVVNLRYRAPSSTGEVVEGTVQAAVTKPFADEFRALRSNRALLQQVAAITGGRVLGPDPTTADLWTRDGLHMPTSTRSIWLELALIAIGVFLLDVAVRRVRIDPAALLALVRRGLRAETVKGSDQMAGLRAARDKATHRAEPVAAGRKFEAGADFTPDQQPITLSGDPAPITIKSKPDQPKPEEGDTLSALRAARKRAQEEFDD